MPLVVGYAYHKGAWKNRPLHNFAAQLDTRVRGAAHSYKPKAVKEKNYAKRA
jgi:hypothetical protein